MKTTLKETFALLVGVSLVASWTGCQSTRSRVQDPGKYQAEVVSVRGFEEPEFVSAAVGEKVTLRVSAPEKDLAFQWFRNSLPLSGETNASVVLRSVGREDAGLYVCVMSPRLPEGKISRAPKAPPVWFSQKIALSTYSTFVTNGVRVLAVTGMPVSTPGSHSCCGPYAGYYVFKPTTAWGYRPVPGAPIHSATDIQSPPRCVSFAGYYGDWGCGMGSVTVPKNPSTGMPRSPYYRFAVYFPSLPLPSSYQLNLVGFE